MCDYCNGSKPLKTGITNDEGIAILYSGGGRYLNAYGYDIFGNKSNGLCVKINYCPMCGSKINERKQSD